jgi:hypothetical protein
LIFEFCLSDLSSKATDQPNQEQLEPVLTMQNVKTTQQHAEPEPTVAASRDFASEITEQSESTSVMAAPSSFSAEITQQNTVSELEPTVVASAQDITLLPLYCVKKREWLRPPVLSSKQSRRLGGLVLLVSAFQHVLEGGGVYYFDGVDCGECHSVADLATMALLLDASTPENEAALITNLGGEAFLFFNLDSQGCSVLHYAVLGRLPRATEIIMRPIEKHVEDDSTVDRAIIDDTLHWIALAAVYLGDHGMFSRLLALRWKHYDPEAQEPMSLVGFLNDDCCDTIYKVSLLRLALQLRGTQIVEALFEAGYIVKASDISHVSGECDGDVWSESQSEFAKLCVALICEGNTALFKLVYMKCCDEDHFKAGMHSTLFIMYALTRPQPNLDVASVVMERDANLQGLDHAILAKAAETGNRAAVKLVFETSVEGIWIPSNIEATIGSRNSGAPMMAADANCTHAFDLFLQYGADPLERAEDGRTAQTILKTAELDVVGREVCKAKFQKFVQVCYPNVEVELFKVPWAMTCYRRH